MILHIAIQSNIPLCMSPVVGKHGGCNRVRGGPANEGHELRAPSDCISHGKVEYEAENFIAARSVL